MWETIFNCSELSKLGGDAITYFFMAAVGTILFLLRLIVGLFGGDAGDFDADADAGTDASFTLFSLLSVMAFVMGTGWMGLACRIDFGLSRAPSALISVGFGVLMMFGIGLFSLVKRFVSWEQVPLSRQAVQSAEQNLLPVVLVVLKTQWLRPHSIVLKSERFVVHAATSMSNR